MTSYVRGLPIGTDGKVVTSGSGKTIVGYLPEGYVPVGNDGGMIDEGGEVEPLITGMTRSEMDSLSSSDKWSNRLVAVSDENDWLHYYEKTNSKFMPLVDHSLVGENNLALVVTGTNSLPHAIETAPRTLNIFGKSIVLESPCTTLPRTYTDISSTTVSSSTGTLNFGNIKSLFQPHTVSSGFGSWSTWEMPNVKHFIVLDSVSVSAVTICNAPELEYCIGMHQNVGTIIAPKLRFHQGATLNIVNANEDKFNLLEEAQSGLSISTTPGASTTITLPKLKITSNIAIASSTMTTTFNFPELITGGFSHSKANVTVNAPNLVNLRGHNIQSGGGYIRIPQTARSIVNGTSFNFSIVLTQAQVDEVLADLAKFDGTNGYTMIPSGTVCNVNNSTTAAPSPAGLASKALLVARGVTVNHK